MVYSSRSNSVVVSDPCSGCGSDGGNGVRVVIIGLYIVVCCIGALIFPNLNSLHH